MSNEKTLRERQINVAEHLMDTVKSSKWRDYKWQLNHLITDIDKLEKILDVKLDPDFRKQIEKTIEIFPMAVTPYYLSLVHLDRFRDDPVFKQAVPSVQELETDNYDMVDPLSEDQDSPVPGITHRYPDRVLFYVNHTCSMYCRHCTRKRIVGDSEFVPNKSVLEQGIQYIRDTPVVRDVLLSGGDPFLLSDKRLDWLLTELRSIPHVEIIRIGTRTPAVLPYRITDELVEMLKKHHPLWINTHFNHPQEITESAQRALAKLADSGIPLGNQSVLLAGVNDCPRIMRALVHKLVQNRVRPYYLYQCDMSKGISHFRTPIGKGIEILERLIGHTTGFAVPTYVIDAPGGGGKIPVMPNYLISWSTNKVILRNYEGIITTYKEPDSYEPIFCNRQCDKCDVQLNFDPASEYRATGIEKLLVDFDETITLIPSDNERIERRDDDDDDI